MLDEQECPFCPDGHEPPQRQNWAVIMDTQGDSDGQPVHLIVCKSNMSHVAESDAAWLRQVIREAKQEQRTSITWTVEAPEGTHITVVRP